MTESLRYMQSSVAMRPHPATDKNTDWDRTRNEDKKTYEEIRWPRHLIHYIVNVMYSELPPTSAFGHLQLKLGTCTEKVLERYNYPRANFHPRSLQELQHHCFTCV